MENPKLALIPSGYKSGKVYSILPVDGDGDFDFSRNTESSRVNKEGLIETVSNNVPRLDWLNSDCPSLLLEPQRTNAFTYSQDFSNSNWTKTEFTIASNQITAPNGTLTASELFETSASSGKFLHQNTSVATGNDYTVSYFIKYQNKQYIQLTGSTGFDVSYVNYDILNGEIVRNLDNADASIENFGNGWYRISLTLEATSTTSGRILLSGIRSATSLRAESYFGSISNSYYIWGGQMEQGSYPTSYIKTTGSAVTRLKDECNNAGDSQLLNNPENTFFIDLNKIYKTGTGDSRISLNDGSATNRVLFSTQTNDTTIILYSIRNNVTTTVKYFSVDYDARNKIAYTFKDNEIKFYVNGEKIHEALFLPIPLNLSKISFDENNGGSRSFQGEVNEIRYYDRALTEAEAIKLTTT